MKKYSFLLSLILLIGSICLSSCSSKEGPAGPAGTAGKDGNANVKSQIIEVNASEWEDIVNGNGYDVSKTCSIITSSIVNNGAVLAYVEQDGAYIALPTRLDAFEVNITYAYEVSTIGFAVEFDNIVPNPENTKFKVVAISSSTLIENPNLDLKNYNEVKQALNLKD
jgi:hypothetical protein